MTEQELEQCWDMFSHAGWKVLAAHMEEALGVKLETAVDSLDDERSLYFLKGEVQQLRAFLSLPDHIRRELDDPEGMGE